MKILWQQRAEDLVKLDGKEELRALKESIEINGYVPVETFGRKTI